VDVDLFDQGTLATSRPAWQVIEAARRRYLTGLLVLDTKPVTNVYLRDGQVYFADRSTDGGLGVRLLVEGVITREQMHRATLMVGGVEHLGRMFDRDSTIDRDAVELCVELMTDDVLTAVADTPVTGYKLHLYKRHPSGVDRWLPTRVEVVTHLVSDPALLAEDTEVSTGEVPRSRPHLVPPPATGEVKIPTTQHSPSYTATVQQNAAPAPAPVVEPVAHVEPVAPPAPAEPVVVIEPIAEVEAQPEPEPAPALTTEHASHAPETFSMARLMSLSEAVTDVVPVISSEPNEPNEATGSAEATEPALPSFASVPPASFTTLQVPAVNGHNGTEIANGSINGHSPEPPVAKATVEVMPGSIADEVAEAVRRALAAIDNP
jgi:hypothetical protein